MPKGTRQGRLKGGSSRVVSSPLGRSAWDSRGRVLRGSEVSDEKVRTLVGDQGLQRVKQADSGKGSAFVYSSDKQKTPTQRKAAAKKVKSSVKKAVKSAVKKVKASAKKGK